MTRKISDLSNRSKDSLIEELPETTQGQMAYYQYAKRRLLELKKEQDKLLFLVQYLKETLGVLIK